MKTSWLARLTEAERLKLMTFALQERGGEKSSRDGRPGERSPEYESSDCQKCGGGGTDDSLPGGDALQSDGAPSDCQGWNDGKLNRTYKIFKGYLITKYCKEFIIIYSSE